MSRPSEAFITPDFVWERGPIVVHGSAWSVVFKRVSDGEEWRIITAVYPDRSLYTYGELMRMAAQSYLRAV